MAKHTKLIPLIIVACDYKFKKFDYNRFELDYLKKYSPLEIWDLSNLSHKSFNDAILASKYINDDLKTIDSYKQLLSELILLKKNYNKNDVFIMNFINPGSMAALFFLTSIKNLGFNCIKYQNSGVPYKSKVMHNISFRYLIKVINRRSYLLLSKLLNIFPTHCIYAGDYWKNRSDKFIKKKGTKLIGGNSWDYSNILFKTSNFPKEYSSFPKKAILLDGAGPMFTSDDAMIGKKTYLTNEIWYPLLAKFLVKVEKITNSTIDIAAHPKAPHKPYPSCFGNRNVLRGKTLEIVREAEFVITRQSTAISYAVFFKKPIVFIYSNQLKKDSLYMANLHKMAELLGTIPININEDLNDLSKHLNINKLSYKTYIENYLTSQSSGRTNAKILLEDIMKVKV